VTKTKSLFPNATIIAGAYPYDRINYIACAYQTTVPCTAAQEQSLYKELLQSQLASVNAGTVMGVEFYPGYFGDPQTWGGWTTQACQPARLSTCIANTNVLQNITLSVLESKAAASEMSPTSISFGDQTLDKESALKTVTYSNTGTAPITFTTINYAGDFRLSNNCPSTLAAGASCSIWVGFAPTALGARTGSLTIRCTSSGTTMAPEVVTLTGTGTD
jgi:hypothetical protein